MVRRGGGVDINSKSGSTLQYTPPRLQKTAMTRKKGEELQQQDNTCSQTTRTSKEKMNQAAAAAAAKLEKFAHPSTSSPLKNTQQQQEKPCVGGPGDRKSLGKGPAVMRTAKTASSKS